MALFIAAKFSQEEMPVIFDPGPLQDLKPQDFVVVPRGESEDVAFVAALEHKPVALLKLRRDPYPRVRRRATPEEVQAWWDRKVLERQALVVCKDKARELKLDIKVSHVRIDMKDGRAIFHFTSEQRIDFRALVRDVSAQLRLRVDLWQIGVRDEARMVDGFGVCGLQTCCSSWLKEFRPITIRMAKEQDINLPPTKLSGQCGRLLCCLSYEVDQYKEMARSALPKGATIRWGEDKEGVIVDRNLVAGTYLVSDQAGGMTTVKAADIVGEPRVPDQMKRMGREMAATAEAAEAETVNEAAPEPASKARKFPKGREGGAERPRGENVRSEGRRGGSEPSRPKAPQRPAPPAQEVPPPPEPAQPASEGMAAEQEASGRTGRRGRKGRRPQPFGAPPAVDGSSAVSSRPEALAPSPEAPREPADGEENRPTGRRRKRGRNKPGRPDSPTSSDE